VSLGLTATSNAGTKCHRRREIVKVLAVQRERRTGRELRRNCRESLSSVGCRIASKALTMQAEIERKHLANTVPLAGGRSQVGTLAN
jgi:hypothetical protein